MMINDHDNGDGDTDDDGNNHNDEDAIECWREGEKITALAGL